MITIEKCSEYNVRVMKNPDFDNMVCGFNLIVKLGDKDELIKFLKCNNGKRHLLLQQSISVFYKDCH